jgi:hypothetical protein
LSILRPAIYIRSTVKSEATATSDPPRLVTTALPIRTEAKENKLLDDALGTSFEVIGANGYIGWYKQSPGGRRQIGMADWGVAGSYAT